MPFKSKRQQRYLYANDPKVAEEFSKSMKPADYKRLPETAKPKAKDKPKPKTKRPKG